MSGLELEAGAGTATCGGAGRELLDTERAVVVVIGVLAGGLGLIGFLNSFARVAAAARPSFGPLAPTVPLGIDLGIAVFCATDIVLARLDMRPKWVRLIPWALTMATVYLNVAGQPSWFARVAHAVFPALWVIAVELAAHVVRVRAGLAAGTRMDTIRPSRWLLAPVRTAGLWRRMVLWETRSYPDALRRERDRLLARTALQDRYGHLAWRWKAPRRDRALYRLGELTPAGDPHLATPAAPDELPPGAAPAPGDRTVPALASAPGGAPADRTWRAPGRTRTRPHPHPVREAGAVSHESAEAHFAAVLAAGQVPSQRRIKSELHVGQDRAAQIHHHLATLTAALPEYQRTGSPS
jgi:hypothetical protein